jgi:hypothetical protein
MPELVVKMFRLSATSMLLSCGHRMAPLEIGDIVHPSGYSSKALRESSVPTKAISIREDHVSLICFG